MLGQIIRNTHKLAATGAVIGSLLAIPAGAAAAPVLSTPLAPCYTVLEPAGNVPSIPLSLSGGGANDSFQVEISDPAAGEGSLGNTEGTFDDHGSATLTSVFTPGNNQTLPTPGEQANLSVIDFTSAGDVDKPLGSTLITNRALKLGFSFIGDNKAHFIQVSGTQLADQKLYGFIVHNGKVVRRISLGTANVCGFARRKYVLTPKHTPLGKYVFYVDAGIELNKKAALSEAYKVELI